MIRNLDDSETGRRRHPRSKRAFDLVVCLGSAPLWVPVLIFGALLLLLFQGRPILYISTRRVYGRESMRLIKFRVMVRDAEKVANRNTCPVVDQRFLNIPADSPLYTPIGRIFERCQIVELPQLLHVITGRMTLIGNRPLPENVIASLKEECPETERRFGTKAGLTSPAQLVGRTRLSDSDRLRLEIAYVDGCMRRYRATLDLRILLRTVLMVVGLRREMSVEEVEKLLSDRRSPPNSPPPRNRHRADRARRQATSSVR